MDKNKRLPTVKQLEIYELIHPDFEGLTIKDAAKKLGISLDSAYNRLSIMRKNHPEAFKFEKFDEKLKGNAKNIEYIYNGYKAKAVASNLEFTITLDDFINVVQLECFVCNQHPSRANRERPRMAYYDKTGYKFPYNHLWRYDVTKGYTYINCVPMCSKCIERRRDNARRGI